MQGAPLRVALSVSVTLHAPLRVVPFLGAGAALAAALGVWHCLLELSLAQHSELSLGVALRGNICWG